MLRFSDKYTEELKHYINLRDSITDFETDYPELASSSQALNKLAKVVSTLDFMRFNCSECIYLPGQMHIASAAARGDDIASLNIHGLRYIALEQPGKQLLPDIAPDADRAASRGYNHPVLSRLLCPARLLQEFDVDPTE